MFILPFMFSAIMNCNFPESRIKALDLLAALSTQFSDDINLERVVPYLTFMLEDRDLTVKCFSLRILKDLVFTGF